MGYKSKTLFISLMSLTYLYCICPPWPIIYILTFLHNSWFEIIIIPSWYQRSYKNKIHVLLMTTLFWYHLPCVMYITTRDFFKCVCLFGTIHLICTSLGAICSIYALLRTIWCLLRTNQSFLITYFFYATSLWMSSFPKSFLMFSFLGELNHLSWQVYHVLYVS